jgi:DNA-binding response OmpR family regulator
MFTTDAILDDTVILPSAGLFSGPVNRPPCILVADDEPRIRLSIRACLEAAGYDVIEARDGEHALDRIIRDAPDVMILDLAMPNLDGIRTMTALSGVHGQLKPRVIVLTAWASLPAAMKTMGLGASLFLSKPIVPETLRAAVNYALHEPIDSQLGVPIDWSDSLREIPDL